MSRADWMLLLLLSLLWGGSFVFVEIALTALPVLTIVWVRVALAALVLAGVIAVTGRAFPRGRAQWAALLVQGTLNNALPFTLFVLAQGQITGGLAAILNATTPLFTVIAAHLLTTDERLTRAKGLGVLVGFAGVAVMMGGATGGSLPAMLACLGAALSYAVASIWARRFRRMGMDPLSTAFGQVSTASLILLPLMLAVDQPWRLPLPAGDVVLAVIALATVSTALAYLIFFRILGSAGATAISLVTFIIPVSATLMGVVILDEPLAPRHLLGFAIIAMGLAAIDGRLLRRRASRP